MKKQQRDYDRDYVLIEMRKNSSKEKNSQAPDFVRHSITSDHLKQYIQHCIQNDEEICFDFAINEKSEDRCLLVLSVPYFKNRKPINLIDNFVESERPCH